jgi:phosphatidylinositol glycan class N
LLPANKVENITMIMTGGAIMVLVGLLYLAFEDAILGIQAKQYRISRSIIGAQIGLIILSMVTTRSSILSIQAKQGLPLGTQVVGWAVMSKLKAM